MYVLFGKVWNAIKKLGSNSWLNWSENCAICEENIETAFAMTGAKSSSSNSFNLT